MRNKLAVAILSLAVFIAGFLVHTPSTAKFGSATPGLPAVYGIATTTLVGPQQIFQIFASSQCTARVVSTAGSAITLIFFDPSGGDISSTTISGSKGIWQGSSTTVAYDSGIYGCGRVFAYSFASSSLNLIETR